MKSLIVLLVLVAGCHNVIVQPHRASTAPPCAASTVMPRQGDVCDGRFTVEGLACVRCDVGSGCVLGNVIVYCTATCNDPACTPSAASHR